MENYSPEDKGKVQDSLKVNSSEPDKKPSAEVEHKNNHKKMVVNELTNSVITNLPPELAEMLKAARQSNNKTESVPDAPKKPSAEVEHKDNRKKVVINELTNSAMTQLPPELTEMLRAARQVNNKTENTKVPSPPAPPVPQNTDDPVIDESGAIFGLQVGKAGRKDVLERMKTLSKVKISNPGESIFKYDDLGIAFYFGEGGGVQEITFSYPFSGHTQKGLQIDDPLQVAIDLYGPPKMQTPAGAIWDKFAVFLKDYTVTTIRLRSS
jgi:hypothetical protein